MDVKSAFLNSNLEEVYVHQPPGFVIPGEEGKVLCLRKALYGLPQASRAWNETLDATLKKMASSKARTRRPISAGPEWLCPVGGRLRRRLDHHRIQGQGRASFQGGDEGYLPDE
jgi:hypothetical protein